MTDDQAIPIEEKKFRSDEETRLPRPFLMRRFHSLLGLFLVVFLCEHLLINSQAGLYFTDEGNRFVKMVNQIHNLPFLPVIEIVFLGLPFLIHGVWGVIYALSSKSNARSTDGAKPALSQYKRNRAYSWQRITSWILLVGVIGHVAQMRFIEQPVHVQYGPDKYYMLTMPESRWLPLVVEQLAGEIYTPQMLEARMKAFETSQPDESDIEALSEREEDEQWLEGAAKRIPKPGDVLVVMPSAGAGLYLVMRETFHSPAFVILYSAFVVAACYHAFNGLWTFMITWGVTLTRQSQRMMRKVTNVLMAVVMLLGLIAIWGTYWTTVFA